MSVGATAAFPVVVLGAGAVVVAAIAGAGIGWFVVVPAVMILLLGALTGAALAAVAFRRGELAWGLALLVTWPVSVPVYVARLRRRSSESEA